MGSGSTGSIGHWVAVGRLDGVLSGVQGAQLTDAVSSLEGALEAAERVELGDVLQGLAAALATAWSAVTSPFAIFGPDMPLVNALFVACFALLAFGLGAKAPRQ
ncbi:hypothetical protein FOA52_013759 [Chlamydomonas sp. UWO 241]|nr:hypothetical protein FOA52_013759 [Chlamydomonas sp. UWO 241]